MGMILTALSLTVSSFGQQTKTCKDGKSNSGNVSRTKNKDTNFTFARTSFAPEGDSDYEKALAVSQDVVVSFCVIGASVRVSGWSRNELRTFIRGKVGFDYDVRGVDEPSGKPVWVNLKAKRFGTDTCLRGKSVQIDAPLGSTLKFKGKSGSTSVRVDSVASANVEIDGGDIALSNIRKAVYAKTNVGAISVRNSTGTVDLETTAGNIVAYDTKPLRIGDEFKAKTVSGTVTLRSIHQKDVYARSISGALNFRGALLKYGRYDFQTTSGLISLFLPVTSGFTLKANYGGDFVSGFRFENVSKKGSQSVISFTGVVGEGKNTTVFDDVFSRANQHR